MKILKKSVFFALFFGFSIFLNYSFIFTATAKKDELPITLLDIKLVGMLNEPNLNEAWQKAGTRFEKYQVVKDLLAQLPEISKESNPEQIEKLINEAEEFIKASGAQISDQDLVEANIQIRALRKLLSGKAFTKQDLLSLKSIADEVSELPDNISDLIKEMSS